MICYVIRSKEKPDMFVVGTPTYISYKKFGRIFPSLAALRTFLSSVMKRSSDKLADWEVIEIDLVEKQVKEVHEVISAKKLKEILMK